MTITLKHHNEQYHLNAMVLNPSKSLKVRNHSPTGFSHGYGGSGPAQLALAILLELLSKKEALARYQQFKWDIIAGLKDDFDITVTIDSEKFAIINNNKFAILRNPDAQESV